MGQWPVFRKDVGLRDVVATLAAGSGRPGLPGFPPVSSLDGLWLFELPGSQPSGPLPTPWLHLVFTWTTFPPAGAQARMVEFVNVTAPVGAEVVPAPPARAFPTKVPPV